jgi:hypothetical protein
MMGYGLEMKMPLAFLGGVDRYLFRYEIDQPLLIIFGVFKDHEDVSLL